MTLAAPRARGAWIVALVAALAALAMALVAFRAQGAVDSRGDPYHYGEYARGFLEHGFDKLTRRKASLYVNFLALVYGAGGSNFTVQVLQCAFQVGICLLAFAIAKRIYDERTALIAGLLCALHPMLLRYTADLHMESMLTFLCTLTVLCAVRFHDRPSVTRGIALGVVGMITTLTKGVMLPYLVVFGAIQLVRALRAPQKQPGIFGLAAMGVSMALLLAPWTYRNYRVTDGRFVLLTPGSSDSFLRGYVFTRLEFATLQKPPYTDAENECNAWFRRIAHDAGVEWEDDEVVDELNNSRVVKQMIRTHPLDTVRKCVVGLFTFWYEMTSLKNSLVPGLLALAAGVLAWLGWKRGREQSRDAWLLLLPIVVMNVFVATLIPLGRYSVPILPCLMCMAAFGIHMLLPRKT